MRIFFLVYVCYCFAIAQCVKAFSYRISFTLDMRRSLQLSKKCYDSSVNYGFNAALEKIMLTTEYTRIQH